ncbi:hypothetical protein HPB50_014683 [Hyalomma asiaticum]|uniref:Uncharacterized protein n=1 Tax=Hyalomma asiaticum TaxID=266040 RepID=A0ACB7SVA9_HYAAI|nr:hypothetical protein HPB50_014683 [Hyalomma asiaticum]
MRKRLIDCGSTFFERLRLRPQNLFLPTRWHGLYACLSTFLWSLCLPAEDYRTAYLNRLAKDFLRPPAVTGCALVPEAKARPTFGVPWTPWS